MVMVMLPSLPADVSHHGAPYRPGWGLRWVQGLQRALGSGVVLMSMILATPVMIVILMSDGDGDEALPAWPTPDA